MGCHGQGHAANPRATTGASGGQKAGPRPDRCGRSENRPVVLLSFDRSADVAWDYAPSNREAFSEDIRPNYDILVLYDYSQEISKAARAHLRDFAEAGKGVVVLHQAIASYALAGGIGSSLAAGMC